MDAPSPEAPPTGGESPVLRRTVTLFAVGLFLRLVLRFSACSCHSPPVDDAMFTASARVRQQQQEEAQRSAQTAPPREAGAGN